MMGKRLICAWACLLWGLGVFVAQGAEPWQMVLARMPLAANVTELNATNCVKVMLGAFQSNDAVKALVFQPGATDEFYWHQLTKAKLTNDSPSLLDAVNALTDQTRIRVMFRPPMLLLRADSDPVEPQGEIIDAPMARRIMQRRFVAHALYNDRDWDSLRSTLRKTCRVDFSPGMYSRYSFHFYRHSFAAWNLTGWEALEVISLAGKTTFRVEEDRVIFQEDHRGL
jgi:hypothetical protein